LAGILFSLALGTFGFGCSSGSKAASNAGPEWTRQPVRTVDGGYIVYIGSGEDVLPERAAFKAEASGIQDIANECSFAPKGTRVEDRFDSVNSVGQHQSFAKVAVSFDECEQAKQTIDPEKVKVLANVAMTEEVKKYQDLVYNPPESLAEAPPGGQPVNGANPALASTSGPPVSDNGTYFIARQQVAFAKEIVILAPPQSYPPQAPQTQQYIAQVQPQTSQIQQYEGQHPETRTWNHSWSGYERNPTTPLPASIPHGRNNSFQNGNRGMNPALRSGSQSRPRGYNQGRRNGRGSGRSQGQPQGRRRRSEENY
jgi:hypothetical protein